MFCKTEVLIQMASLTVGQNGVPDALDDLKLSCRWKENFNKHLVFHDATTMAATKEPKQIYLYTI
jgi:hypothetical protein